MSGDLAQAGTGAGGGGGVTALSPSVKTLTGETYKGKPVFHQHFSGSATNNEVLVTGVDHFFDQIGNGVTSGSQVVPNYHDGTNSFTPFKNASDEILTQVLGSFVGTAYAITVKWTDL